MSKATMTDVSMQKNSLLDTPYEILFEIFQTLSRGKLIKISKLCSKFRHVAEDTRLWKNVYIKYGPSKNYSFEELYSEPWPVKVIDLSCTRIYPPVSSPTEHIIKVEELHLSLIKANEVTIAAILAKYQCTELHWDRDILGIGSEAFSKQTALEVLSVQGVRRNSEDIVQIFWEEVHQVLPTFIKNFKNLKTLDLRHITPISLEDFDMSDFFKSLPTSLEKLFLRVFPKDPFFGLLAEITPNLRELGVLYHLKSGYESLLNFRFLETLHFDYVPGYEDNISHLYKYLTNFPALKTVCIIANGPTLENSPETFPEKLRTMLQPHGIIVGITKYRLWPLLHKDKHLWEVSKS